MNKFLRPFIAVFLIFSLESGPSLPLQGLGCIRPGPVIQDVFQEQALAAKMSAASFIPDIKPNERHVDVIQEILPKIEKPFSSQNIAVRTDKVLQERRHLIHDIGNVIGTLHGTLAQIEVDQIEHPLSALTRTRLTTLKDRFSALPGELVSIGRLGPDEQRVRIMDLLDHLGDRLEGMRNDVEVIRVSGEADELYIDNLITGIDMVEGLYLKAQGLGSKEAVDVNDLLRSVVQKARALGNHVVIHETYANDLPLVWINKADFSNVFLNLLINARHAVEGKPQGWVHVITEPGHKKRYSIRLIVTDNGHGIPKHLLPDRHNSPNILTEGFSTKGNRGMGMGLSSVARIIRAHRGELHILSKGEGQGASFIIDLPSNAVVKKLKASPVVAEPLTPTTRPPEPKVLVVDDNEDFRNQLAFILSMKGLGVETASHGMDALEKLKDLSLSPWLAVVTDRDMPQLDGIGLIHEIGRLIETNVLGPLFIFLMSGEEIVPFNVNGLAGFIEIFQKPIDIFDLTEKLKAVPEKLRDLKGNA